ncbi:MAG: hypothetical protein WAQ53_18545 [Thiofilum sp.]|uniref:hypothetical protein n=1 Tax=Thiofilum sp. TaxID=2212733 RepID=UPI0025E0F45D|nr:hypothetical protein [Thiofilum sp.]MBK8455567.1 hypothetical protein [Thiofilum sp.]
MELSIKETLERFKMGRSTLYKKFSSGELSRLPNGKVDLAELLRVFGDSPRLSTSTPRDNTETLANTPLFQAQADKIRLLEESLREAKERERTYLEREAWQRGQIEKLTESVKMLEAPKTQPSQSRVWWKFWRNFP